MATVNLYYCGFNPKCRLGNQLYFALNAYKLNKTYPGNTINQVITTELQPYFIKLNVPTGVFEQAVVQSRDFALAFKCDFNQPYGIANMFQDFGICYTEDMLNSFISSTIMQSELYKTIESLFKPSDDTVAVTIRGGDYTTDENSHYKFDFTSFLTASISGLTGIRNADIYSDDIEYCRQFESIFTSKSIGVRYISPTFPCSDLIKQSLYRHKIIWNSTFAYWTAYISNCHFTDNCDEIIVPQFHSSLYNDGKSWQLNPKWRIINA